MRKILFLGCACFIAGTVSAEETSFTPESGLYVGIGLANTQDQVDWDGSAVELGSQDYASIYFSNSTRRFNGQAFFGYKGYKPFFWAIECNLNFAKNKLSKTYDHNNLIGGITAWRGAVVNIEAGDDISVAVKIGKTLRNTVTPYVMLGCCYQKSDFRLSYVTNSSNANDDPWRESGSYKSVSKIAFMFGAGCSLHLDDKTETRLEYRYRPNCTFNYTTTVNTTDVDEPGYPRMFQLKRCSHCISLGISRTICW